MDEAHRNDLQVGVAPLRITTGLCQNAPLARIRKALPPGPPPQGGGLPPYLQSWRKNLKCSCTLRFQNFLPVCAYLCVAPVCVRTRTGRPPCLQTKSIILTHPQDSDTAPQGQMCRRANLRLSSWHLESEGNHQKLPRSLKVRQAFRAMRANAF